MIKRLIKNDKGLGDTIIRFTHWFDVRYGAGVSAVVISSILAYLGPWFYGPAAGSSALGGIAAYWYREKLTEKMKPVLDFFAKDQNGKFHIAAVVEWFAKKVLRLDDCGCGNRAARLNSMFPYRKTSLTIAMPHKGDWEGVWATVNFFRDEIIAEGLQKWVDINVIDQQPEWGVDKTGHGHIHRLCQQITASGVRCSHTPYTEKQGSAPAKNAAFRHSTGDWVMVVDCHIQLERRSLKKTFKYIQKNALSNDLYHGMLLSDDRRIMFTGLEMYQPNMKGWSTPVPKIGNDLVFGTWTHETVKAMPKKPFEIEACGGWCILSRRMGFVGYHPLMSGFGGEEGYTHEATRQRGHKVYALPFLRGVHRFNRMNPVEYGGNELIIRNHIIGCLSIGKDLNVWREALLKVGNLAQEDLDRIISETISEYSQRVAIDKLLESKDPTEKREGLFMDSVTKPWGEHLPALRVLAGMDPHVVEIGTRGDASTIAILAAQPAVFHSFDTKEHCSCKHLNKIAGDTDLKYVHGPEGDATKFNIPTCGLLFINHRPQEGVTSILDRQESFVGDWIVVHGNVSEAAEWASNHSDLWPFLDSERPDGLCVIGRNAPEVDKHETTS